MEYSVAQLAGACAISVDTLRYYQTLGLLDPPAKDGRHAVYGDEHHDRLQLIRTLAAKGLSLRVIKNLLERGTDPMAADRALLAALEEESAPPTFSRADLARELGVPEALLRSVEKTGIAEPQEDEHGEHRYSEADLRAARGALRLLEHGFPLTRLLALAVRHDRAMRKTVDDAIDLFDDYVRKGDGGGERDDDAIAESFRELLPVVTALVGHHFQRILVNRALKRLKKSGERGPLRTAVEVAKRSRLSLRWRS